MIIINKQAVYDRMDKSILKRLRDRALETAERIGMPSFYADHRKELAASRSSYERSHVIESCLSYLDEESLHPAHGLYHCQKVAVEAGAVLMAEASGRGHSAKVDDLMLCCHIAGLFHDIKRAVKDHSVAGSEEATRILNDFPIEGRYKRYIAAAIRNHEAFREVLGSEDDSARLISDALYDADKFRWGPDNFTTTLWLIVESSGISEAALFSDFMTKMDGIRKIGNTFRTGTGKKYGPEFIACGMEIGDSIYQEMSYIMRNG